MAEEILKFMNGHLRPFSSGQQVCDQPIETGLKWPITNFKIHKTKLDIWA